MGYSISTFAYGPNQAIAAESLVAALKASGYPVTNSSLSEEPKYVWIDNYGKYRFRFARLYPDVVKAEIVWDASE